MKKNCRLITTSFLWLASCIGAFSVASQVHAFCGFYVSPTDEPLYNDASMVALMREGTRTVISMSNNYKGPAKDFAMVVPVPVVLQKENVKTLPLNIFKKLEQLSAPRLVEYWEQDPCGPPPYEPMVPRMGAIPIKRVLEMGENEEAYGVKIEAQFTVGEYNVMVLSAAQSDGLERWLVDNKYNIPKGASKALAPYIKEQQKFFVAKVNIEKVVMNEKGVAVLSPLRFHYEESNFRLPVRLGLLNAQGKQDLIVYVLAKGKRYEVANYENVFIPTNLDVRDSTRDAFGSFYATLFDAAMYKAGGRAVVTEYAWETSSCDPCPTPPLDNNDVATLGGDVLLGMGVAMSVDKNSPGVVNRPMMGRLFLGSSAQGIVLTRLHTRYDGATLNEDLVFKVAEPVVGGREHVIGQQGELEKGARADSINNFQARYSIRHAWTGPIACDKPRRGVWGGPPLGQSQPKPRAAIDLASAPRTSVKLVAHIAKGLANVASWDDAAQKANAGLVVVSTAPSVVVSNTKIESSPTLAPVTIKRNCGCSFLGASHEWSLGMIGVFITLGLVFVRRR